jgi:hypothetical protein
MLFAVAYSRDWQQLYLKFKSGDVYCYREVPSGCYQELLAADSKGTYAQNYILHCYPYQRVYIDDGPQDHLRSADQRLGVS